MSQLVERLVRSGQLHNLMGTIILMWESTITAGIQMGILMEFGASPLILRNNGSTALSQDVMQHTNVKKVIPWVSAIPEGQTSQLVEGLVRLGQPQNLIITLNLLLWESTITAGIRVVFLKEFGASPMIQIK